MNTNLGHPNNKQANELVQYQRIASMWANGLSRGILTRSKVTRLISEYPPQAQPVLTQWLNTCREAIKQRQQANQPKRRVVPHWVKR